MSDAGGETAPGWTGRVAFSEHGGGVAYRPGQVLVGGQRGLDEGRRLLPGTSFRGDERVFAERAAGQFHLLRLAGDPFELVEDLRLEGVVAQPNHVLFTHCGPCCGPHPALRWQGGLDASPFHASPFHASPFHASPFHASPFHASPFHASPFHASQVQASGRRPSSARPARPPALAPAGAAPGGARRPRIAVLDTGFAAEGLRPTPLQAFTCDEQHWEHPDEDQEGHLDPAAGHGTFIAGLIDQLAPGCDLGPERVLTTMGDGDEATVARRIDELAAAGGVDLLNLSFGGYALERPHVLEAAVRRVQAAGTVVVASAGNDGSCRPVFPASLPGVIGVAAIGPDGPATFTNHGPWVRACAPGVDLVAPFFNRFTGPVQAPAGGTDPDDFEGWARWSGTSFAAPVVVAALAREMQRSGASAEQAVARVVDAPGLLRIPDLGTVVNIQ